MTNISLASVLYLPLDSHLELYISHKLMAEKSMCISMMAFQQACIHLHVANYCDYLPTQKLVSIIIVIHTEVNIIAIFYILQIS